jgi:hypothetical protein
LRADSGLAFREPPRRIDHDAAELDHGEIARAEALVMRGSEPRYLAWLREAAELAAARAGSDDPAVAGAAAVVRDVVRNQAGLLLGLPGGGRRRERARRALEVS